MSQCRELISEVFPHIDHEISDYVNSKFELNVFTVAPKIRLVFFLI